jgi:hypothetical protein
VKCYNRYSVLGNCYNNENISQCCGSRWFKHKPAVYHNEGIVVWPSKEKVEKDDEECWTHSIPVGEEFLVVRHRKVV